VESWYVYLLQCKNGNIYTGISTDVSRRIKEHREGKKGAKFLRGKGPLKLLIKKKAGNRSSALKLEYRIKRLPRIKKEMFVRGTLNLK
jgi:putative endonuclease